MNDTRVQPWYREPWPWILMAAPAAAVAAGLITFWLAVRSEDGLVVDDYYKEGLAINETLHRAETAARLGMTAELELDGERVRVRLTGAGRAAPMLRFAHPTRSGMDQRVRLVLIGPDLYEARIGRLESGRWHVVLEQRDWRLAGDWVLPASGSLRLGTAVHAPSKRADPLADKNTDAQSAR